MRRHLPLVIVSAAIVIHLLIATIRYYTGKSRGLGQDFFVMYTATRYASAGENPYVGNHIELALRDYWQTPANAADPPAGFFYPPQAMLLFKPLAMLPFSIAVVGWYLLNTLLAVSCGALVYLVPEKALHGGRDPSSALIGSIVSAIFLLNPLTQRMFSLGQTSLVIPGAFAIAVWLLRGQKLRGTAQQFLAAAIVSFAAIKPHLALPLFAILPFIFGLRFTLISALFVGLFTIAGCLVTTGSLMTIVNFIRSAQSQALSIGFNQVTYDQVLSWNRIAYMFTGIAINLKIKQIVVGYAVFAAISIARLYVQQRWPSPPFLAAAAGMASLLCSQAKGYDLVIAILIVPYALRLRRAHQCRNFWSIIIALLLCASIPRGLIVAMLEHTDLSEPVRAAVLSYRAFVVLGLSTILIVCGEPVRNRDESPVLIASTVQPTSTPIAIEQ